MFFSTFGYDIVSEYHDGIMDFLCKMSSQSSLQVAFILLIIAKIGGWIGLIVGASLISFIEFAYFAYLLVKSACCGRKSVSSASTST